MKITTAALAPLRGEGGERSEPGEGADQLFSKQARDEMGVTGSLQFGVFPLGLFDDGDIRVGVLPKGEEVRASLASCAERMRVRDVPARPWHNPRRFQHSRGFSEIRLPRRCLQCRSYVNEQCNRLTRHWKFLINTASIGLMPRERARRPSRDQSNQKILSEAKCVTGFGRPPATGCSRCYSHHSRCW